MTRTILLERRAGTRTIGNTDHPIVDQLVRDGSRSRPQWHVIYGLCNGVPEHVDTYRTQFIAKSVFANLLIHGSDAYPITQE